MTKKVTILGKMLPIWLAVILLIASGTGAAAGTIIVGKVTGEINVATTGTGAGGLLIGAPICDFLKHTPNDVIHVDNTGAPPFAVWPAAPWTTVTDLSKLAFPDAIYEHQTAAVPPATAGQAFRFYVGDKINISQMVLTYKGKATALPGVILMWDNTAAAYTPIGTITTTDQTITVTINTASAVTLTNAVNSAGSVYVAVTSGPGDGIDTDYISLTTTQTAFDLKNWAGAKIPEIARRTFTVPDRCIGVHSSDQTGFEAAAEIAVGDWWIFMLPLKNVSKNDVTAKLTLTVPSCLNAYTLSADNLGDRDYRVSKVTQIGVNTWKLIVKQGAAKQDDDDYLYIIINAHDDCPPGIYEIKGVLEMIAY